MASRGKRIGFVDYDLDNFHADTFLAAIRGPLKERGFTVAGCTAVRKEPGRAWANQNHVPYFAKLEDLNEAADVYMVLAPSNPEQHMPLCQKIFPFGKPTYVDKTFAPDLPTARRIFELADENKVAVQTSSALRYTNVQERVRREGAAVRHMVAWGGGRFEEYAVHPVEMIVSCMGAGATRIMRRGDDRFAQLLLEFSGGRTAVANVIDGGATTYAASINIAAGTHHMEVERSTLFVNTAAAILDFLESGIPLVDRAESLVIRRILDAAGEPAARERFVEL